MELDWQVIETKTNMELTVMGSLNLATHPFSGEEGAWASIIQVSL